MKLFFSVIMIFFTSKSFAGTFSGVTSPMSKLCLVVFQDASIESEKFQFLGSSETKKILAISVETSPGVCGIKLTVSDPSGEYSTVDQTICLGDGGRLLPDYYFSIPGNEVKREEPAIYMKRVLCVSAEETLVQDGPGPLISFSKKLRVNLETGYWVKEYPTANPSKLGEASSVLISKKP